MHTPSSVLICRLKRASPDNNPRRWPSWPPLVTTSVSSPLLHFLLPFFFLPPEGVGGADVTGPPASTRTASSSLVTTLPLADESVAGVTSITDSGIVVATGAAAVPASLLSSCTKSFSIVARRFSHHSVSDWVLASISLSLSVSAARALISLADWKMICPHPGYRALACLRGSKNC